jgi:hypothetical protein
MNQNNNNLTERLISNRIIEEKLIKIEVEKSL